MLRSSLALPVRRLARRHLPSSPVCIGSWLGMFGFALCWRSTRAPPFGTRLRGTPFGCPCTTRGIGNSLCPFVIVFFSLCFLVRLSSFTPAALRTAAFVWGWVACYGILNQLNRSMIPPQTISRPGSGLACSSSCCGPAVIMIM